MSLRLHAHRLELNGTVMRIQAFVVCRSWR